MINIENLIPLLKKGWVAMDKNGDWHWFSLKPKICFDCWLFNEKDIYWEYLDYNHLKQIAPVEDWKKSLINVG